MISFIQMSLYLKHTGGVVNVCLMMQTFDFLSLTRKDNKKDSCKVAEMKKILNAIEMYGYSNVRRGGGGRLLN